MKRRWGWLAVGLLALGGCGNDVTTERAGGSVMMAIPREPKEVQLAIFEGSLTRTDQGCLAAKSDQTLVVQFPYGSTLAADGQSVDIPSVGTLHLGESFSGGGGTGDLTDLRGVPDECRGGNVFFSWQTGGAILP